MNCRLRRQLSPQSTAKPLIIRIAAAAALFADHPASRLLVGKHSRSLSSWNLSFEPTLG
jgi:hypothetical protein